MTHNAENDVPPCPVCGGNMRFCECMDDPFAPVPDSAEKDATEHAVSSGWFRGEYWVECSCGRTATCSRGREWVGGNPKHIHTHDCLPQSCPATWPSALISPGAQS